MYNQGKIKKRMSITTKGMFGSDVHVWQLDCQNLIVKVFGNTIQLDFGSSTTFLIFSILLHNYGFYYKQLYLKSYTSLLNTPYVFRLHH